MNAFVLLAVRLFDIRNMLAVHVCAIEGMERITHRHGHANHSICKVDTCVCVRVGIRSIGARCRIALYGKCHIALSTVICFSRQAACMRCEYCIITAIHVCASIHAHHHVAIQTGARARLQAEYRSFSARKRLYTLYWVCVGSHMSGIHSGQLVLNIKHRHPDMCAYK